MLLEAGVEMNAGNSCYGRTALHHLCQGVKDVEVFDVLVKAGMDVDIRDTDGETPLISAMCCKSTPRAERLIALGADINLFELSSKHSVILSAVKFSHHGILPLLLQKGADYTTLNVYGRNIAHIAARSSNARTMSILAEADLIKVDMNLQDMNGNTPADLLAERSRLVVHEAGLCEAFDKLMRSVTTQRIDASHTPTEDLGSESEVFDEHRIPGAYPIEII